jgi:hypothetical protein
VTGVPNEENGAAHGVDDFRINIEAKNLELRKKFRQPLPG